MEDCFPSEPDPRGHTAEALLDRARVAKLKLVFGRLGSATDLMVEEFQAVAQALAADAGRTGVGSGRSPPLGSPEAAAAAAAGGFKSIDEVALPPVAGHEAVSDELSTAAGNHEGAAGTPPAARAASAQAAAAVAAAAGSVSDDLAAFGCVAGGVEGERRAFLRDVLRESVLVGAVHLEVLAAVRVAWALPAHPSQGAWAVAAFELQRRTVPVRGAPPTAKQARQARRRRAELLIDQVLGCLFLEHQYLRSSHTFASPFSSRRALFLVLLTVPRDYVRFFKNVYTY
jgi:hypothetical protein